MSSDETPFDLFSELDRIDAENAELLERTIEAAMRAGKEEFDINVLKQKYHRQGLMQSGSMEDLPDEVVDFYRNQYYLTYPSVMTMEEFIRELEQGDRYFE